MMKRLVSVLSVAILTVAVVGAASADGFGREGYGPRSMMGPGYGPGTMMGQGYGYGMMGPCGGFGPMMGPGMMGQGYGYGQGMMGPGGGFGGMMMGPGMMAMMHEMMHGELEGHMGGRFSTGSFLRFKDRLGLTDEQVASLESFELSLRKETIQKGAEIRIAELELDDLLDEDQLDLTKIEGKLREIEGLRTDLKLSRIKTSQSAKGVLTEEQLARWESLRRGSFTAPPQGKEQGMEEMMKGDEGM